MFDTYLVSSSRGCSRAKGRHRRKTRTCRRNTRLWSYCSRYRWWAIHRTYPSRRLYTLQTTMPGVV